MSPIPMTYWKWQLAFVPWRNELVPPGANTSFLMSNPECSSNLIQQNEVSELVCHSERRLQTRTACWRIIKMESGLWEHGSSSSLIISSSPLIIFPLVTDRCQLSGSQIYLKNVAERFLEEAFLRSWIQVCGSICFRQFFLLFLLPPSHKGARKAPKHSPPTFLLPPRQNKYYTSSHFILVHVRELLNQSFDSSLRFSVFLRVESFLG